MPDSDGYPTDEELNRVRNWDLKAHSAHELVDYLSDIWWHEDIGVVVKGNTIRLHTHGWSGNEDIISMLRQTMFWFLFWEKSERGGHYTFKIRKIKGMGNGGHERG